MHYIEPNPDTPGLCCYKGNITFALDSSSILCMVASEVPSNIIICHNFICRLLAYI